LNFLFYFESQKAVNIAEERKAMNIASLRGLNEDIFVEGGDSSKISILNTRENVEKAHSMII
jgi:hypothetical protein